MKNNLKLLTGVLVILIAVSYFVIQNNQSKNTLSNDLFIPELQSKINNVDEILIRKNEKIISLLKRNETWTVLEAENYFADANKVANLLLSLRKLNLKEQKTSNPDKYKLLSLAESGEDAGIKITLKSAGNQIASVTIGKNANKSNGSYVRNNSAAQSWLSDNQIDIDLEFKDWIVTNIIDIDSSRVKSVNYQVQGKQAFNINKITPKDQQFSIENMPENSQLKESTDLNVFANGLQKLTIESASTLPSQLSEVLATITYQLFSGMSYQLNLFKVEGQHYLQIQLENPENSSEFDKQLEHWLFVIPSYKYDALSKGLLDVIESKPLETMPAEANS